MARIKIIGYTFNSSQADAIVQSCADACLQKMRSAQDVKKCVSVAGLFLAGDTQ